MVKKKRQQEEPYRILTEGFEAQSPIFLQYELTGS
jgi:hypothetical protein